MNIENITSAIIKISVEYYNDTHEELLNDSNRYADDFIERMKEVVSNGVEITGAEYLVNSLFYKKLTNPNKYNHRSELVDSMQNGMHYFVDDLELSSDSIRVPSDSNPEAAIVMKRVGESIGLSVISRIIGTIEADWTVIPELGIKAFDFGYAVTTKGLVQVETKGSSSNDINFKNSNIFKHAKNIADKKVVMRGDINHPFRGDYNYGTITFCPVGGENNVKCFLLDPPPGASDIRFAEVKISKRLGFYHRVMSFISPDSRLLNLLFNRMVDFAEERVTIKKSTELRYSRGNNEHFYESFFLFKTNTDVRGIGISGDWFYFKKNFVVFIGMQETIIDDIVLQNNDTLLKKQLEVYSEKKEIQLNVLTGYQRQEYRKLAIDNGKFETIKSVKKIKAKGKITILASGIAIGILKVIDQ